MKKEKEKLKKEIARCLELQKLYDEIPEGCIGSSIIAVMVKIATKSLESDDLDTIKKNIKSLEEITG